MVLFFCERFLEVSDGLHSGACYFRLSSLVLVLHHPQVVHGVVGSFSHHHHQVSPQTVLQIFVQRDFPEEEQQILRGSLEVSQLVLQ